LAIFFDDIGANLGLVFRVNSLRAAAIFRRSNSMTLTDRQTSVGRLRRRKEHLVFDRVADGSHFIERSAIKRRTSTGAVHAAIVDSYGIVG